MKSFNRHQLAILPLLTILCASPGVIESKHNYRTIASDISVSESFPKLESFRKNQKPESIQKDQNNSLEKFKIKRDTLSEKIKKERETFKKDQSDKIIVEEQQKLVHSLAIEILVVEADLKDLQDKKLIDTEEEISIKLEKESKNIIEGLLRDLESNQSLVAKAEIPKVEEPKKEEPKKEVCESDEKNKVLTSQVEELLKQQQQILQTMMGMAQMMVSMFQQQQRNPMANSFAYEHSLYRYNQPTTAGNWVYYPNGFQPSQPNIFTPQQAPIPQSGGIYPDQVHQAPIPKDMSGDWSMRPTEFFPDPRFQTQYMAPGQFGNDPYSFNMSAPFPTVTQR
jgi:hypothetical protein